MEKLASVVVCESHSLRIRLGIALLVVSCRVVCTNKETKEMESSKAKTQISLP